MKIGDKIRIDYMEGEPEYTGREGVIQLICQDPWGDTCIRGTWGGCVVYLKTDSFTILEGDNNG